MWSFIWTNLNSLHQRMLCAKFGWNWPSGSGEVWGFFVNVSSLFRNYLPLEKGGPFFWTKLNPLHPRMLWTKFGWNWLSSSGEEDENVKGLRTDGQGRTVDQKSSLELLAQLSLKLISLSSQNRDEVQMTYIKFHIKLIFEEFMDIPALPKPPGPLCIGF